MKQSLFIDRHREEWEDFEELLVRFEGRGLDRFGVRTDDFSLRYRGICHLAALARDRGYSNHLVAKLADLALRGHQQLYQRRSVTVMALLYFFYFAFPVKVREHRRYFWVSCALFSGPLLLVCILGALDPQVVFNLMSPERLAEMERMYDPNQERLGRLRDSGTDLAMFGFYISNNIGISFQMFAGGVFFGLMTVFALFFNGYHIGVVTIHLINVGSAEPFFSFVIAHSAFELTGLVVAGAAGLMLGHSLLEPGRLSRLEALKLAAREALFLVYGAFAMLLLAAFVEAFWSSLSLLPLAVKMTLGLFCWLTVIGYLSLMGRRPRGSR